MDKYGNCLDGVCMQNRTGTHTLQVHQWVNITLTCFYWAFTVGAFVILGEVIRGNSVRAKMIVAKNPLNRRVTLVRKSCCSRHSLKMISFYMFAIVTLVSRAVLMTLKATFEDIKDLTQDSWYWLSEVGPYSYILTGDVIIIFLIDVMVRVAFRGSTKKHSMILFGAKAFLALIMVVVIASYIIPGILIQANNSQSNDTLIEYNFMFESLAVLNMITFLVIAIVSMTLLYGIQKLFHGAAIRSEKFQLITVLSFYSGSFLLMTCYYIYSAIEQDQLSQGALDFVTLFRYLFCECLPLGLVMAFQFKNHKLLIKEWHTQQSLNTSPKCQVPISSKPVSNMVYLN